MLAMIVQLEIAHRLFSDMVLCEVMSEVTWSPAKGSRTAIVMQHWDVQILRVSN